MSEEQPQVFRPRRSEEIFRWAVLAAIAAWLLHPYATNRQIGAGDALWYANMLADFCLQWRAGVFPVFVGQTDFAFNGAVYPLRVAPLYQHLAGILDLLTARQLGWFALQHLVVIVMGVAGIFSCYFSLVALAPERRWPAVGFSVLYLSCPGVLGTLYTQDLYMTWTTLPFVPLAFYGAVRAFQQDDIAAQLWWAGGLAALWFAHSPIALWTTLLTGLLQVVRLLFVHSRAPAWKRAILGGAIFAALAHYPFVSVNALQASGGPSAVTGGLENPERISNVVREVYPAALLPVSDHARALSDLQLGYGFWAVWLGVCLSLAFFHSWAMRGLIAGCALLFFLVLPLPGNEWLWSHLPGQIKRITFYWPMHRFYLLLAAMLACGGQLALAAWMTRSVLPLRRAATILLVVACTWSLFESRQFIEAANERTASSEISALRLRPENRLLMNHAYGLFAALPSYFSNGVMDVRAEARLLDRTTLAPIVTSSTLSSDLQPLRGEIDDNPGVLKLEPSLRLEPSHQYVLEFEFHPRTYTGILQLAGKNFFREYVLPLSGQKRAFGSGPEQSHSLPLWTTDPAGDEITLRFIPTTTGETPADYANFGRYRLREPDAFKTGTYVTNGIVLRADVNAAQPAWLELPRMFQPGYVATIDAKPVPAARSPEGLVMVPVESGVHGALIEFRGPAALRISYWMTLLAWSALLIASAVVAVRRIRN